MKKIIIALVSFTFTYATCLPFKDKLEGRFEYHSYTPTFKFIAEIVHMGTNEGRLRAKELKANDYICQHVNNYRHRCKKIEKYQDFEKLRDHVQKKYGQDYLQFNDEVRGINEMVNASHMKKWEVKQIASTSNEKSYKYFYYALKGINKIELVNNRWFNIDSCHKLHSYSAYRRTIGKQMVRYYYKANFKK